MKPLSILQKIRSGTGYLGEDADEDTIDAQRIVIHPSAGTSFDIKGLKSLTDAYMVVIVEAKIGDRFIWPDSILDVGMFKDVHPYFEEPMGVITEEEPLELFVKHFGQPSIYPFLNLAIFGDETILDAEEVMRNKEAAERRVGIVHFREFREWLDKATSLELPNVEHVVAAYLAGDDPPAEEISADALLKAVMAHCEEHGAHGFIEQFLQANFKDPNIVAQGMAAVRQMIQAVENPAASGAVAGWSGQQGRRTASGQPTTGLVPPPNPRTTGPTGPSPKRDLKALKARLQKKADPPRGATLVSTERFRCGGGWSGNHRVNGDDEVKVFKERTGLFSLHINGIHQDFNLPQPPKFRLTK